MEITNGPIHAFGNATSILNAPGQGQSASILVPDPNDDRGPSVFFAGTGIPDLRFTYSKDKVAGYTGVVPSHLSMPVVQSVNAIPAAFQTSGICGAQTVVSGTAMTLQTSSAASQIIGITTNVPIVPFAGFGGLNGAAVVTTGIALDFGFQFGNVTAATKQITVADTSFFTPGMPLVIATVGNAAGTAPLLTNVASIDSAVLLTLVDAPLCTNAIAAIGTGNLWGPSENGFPTPTGALPYLAMGPGLFLDPAQALCRGVSFTGSGAGCAGGTATFAGYDVYGMAMTETVTVAAGAATGFGKKCFKYVTSVTPNFSDGVQTYSAGTSDVVGFAMRSDFVELIEVTFNLVTVTDGVGWLKGDTATATATTGDTRGTVQLSTANGGGTAITNQAATNGTQAGLVMTGRRLHMAQQLPPSNLLRGLVTNTKTLYGNTQA